METFEWGATIGLFILLFIGGYKIAKALLWRPKPHETLDYYRGTDDYRASIDVEREPAHPAGSSPWWFQALQILLEHLSQQRQLPPVVQSPPVEAPALVAPLSIPAPTAPAPEPVAEARLSAGQLEQLQSSDPEAFVAAILDVITRLYVANADRHFSRDGLVKPKVVEQSEFDFWIGPERSGTKQPGFLRQIDGLIVGNQFQANREECTTLALLYFLGLYGDRQEVQNAVRKIDHELVEDWLNGDWEIQKYFPEPEDNNEEE